MAEPPTLEAIILESGFQEEAMTFDEANLLSEGQSPEHSQQLGYTSFSPEGEEGGETHQSILTALITLGRQWAGGSLASGEEGCLTLIQA